MSLTADVLQWIETKLEKPHPAYGGMPICPYARAARLAGAIAVECDTTGRTLEGQVRAVVRDWPDGQEACVIVLPLHSIACPDQLRIEAERLDEQLRPDDLCVLYDHPAEPQVMNGVNTSFGKAILVIIQRRSHLIEASKKLRQTGYYDSWPLALYEEMVKGREA